MMNDIYKQSLKVQLSTDYQIIYCSSTFIKRVFLTRMSDPVVGGVVKRDWFN